MVIMGIKHILINYIPSPNVIALVSNCQVAVSVTSRGSLTLNCCDSSQTTLD
jgi:hypothetical protein